MKYLAIFALAGIALIGCEKDENPEKSTTAPLAYETISEGNLYGGGEEGFDEENFVITSESEWNDFLEQIDSYNEVSNNFSTTTVDFSTSVVVACFDKVRSSGGYAISVEEVTDSGDEISLEVKRENPGGIATTVITQPYALYILNVTDRTIVFD